MLLEPWHSMAKHNAGEALLFTAATTNGQVNIMQQLMTMFIHPSEFPFPPMPHRDPSMLRSRSRVKPFSVVSGFNFCSTEITSLYLVNGSNLLLI